MTYVTEYHSIRKCKSNKDISSVSEQMLIAYFCEKLKEVEPSPLWSYYSLLKRPLLVDENYDISKYVSNDFECNIKWYYKICTKLKSPNLRTIWDKMSDTGSVWWWMVFYEWMVIIFVFGIACYCYFWCMYMERLGSMNSTS